MIRPKRWSLYAARQRVATLAKKMDFYTARLSDLGEPRDRHARRSVTMYRKSLKRAEQELAVLRECAPAAFGVLEARGETFGGEAP